MDKRGSHADWAISMGIFLVYLLVLFIIIRPGTEKVYDEKILLDIVEGKFNEEVKWTVKMSPLFVKKCEAGPRATKIIVKDESENWKFTNVKTDKYACINKQGDFELICAIGENCICADGCPSVKGNFDLYYIPEGKAERETSPKLKFECLGIEKWCSAEVGSSENLEGINWIWLNELKNMEYDTIKENWNFPRDFSITINDEKIGGEPYENANVFVREWNDFEVNEKGERKEVKISVKVW